MKTHCQAPCHLNRPLSQVFYVSLVWFPRGFCPYSNDRGLHANYDRDRYPDCVPDVSRSVVLSLVLLVAASKEYDAHHNN